ncbi:zinc-dependent alcohol dehydrogenase family protein [Saccharopolyspora sp. TS4A08]|uniref:Zinc-dependent alcohol dehydrogenase family protein n=1 Tax=Saccharopolyspora ipomoeae TaxID=3042027 RepID=A0ABT6PX84_9PSEU|nr:zinc-dependent alcohol dehydrogenase family protein [Saccharopolyspora sp. TS4A08]MDI2032460.1 zinc-dependent alcohol dehydrogenase family protein [Saccharopolyspora sp. TS4A08]
MARVARFHQVGGPEVLRVEEVPTPEPGPGEVLIETRALGLNRAELEFRAGRYGQPSLPSGIGFEAAGVVRAVGAGVAHVAPGAAVSVLPAFGPGTYALHGDAVLAPADAVVEHPPNLSWEQAAAVWMSCTTAYGGLVETAGVSAGDVVLIPAASSGVGLAAIQLCTALGARPIALTRTGGKRSALRGAGAAEVIATAEQDVVAEVRRLTGGRGARVAFDPVGGAGFTDLSAALAPGGIAVVYGTLAGGTTPLPVGDVLAKGLTIRGYALFETTGDPDRRTAAIEFLHAHLADGTLVPHIGATFPFDRIADAHTHMESTTHLGKIVLRTDRQARP